MPGMKNGMAKKKAKPVKKMRGGAMKKMRGGGMAMKDKPMGMEEGGDPTKAKKKAKPVKKMRGGAMKKMRAGGMAVKKMRGGGAVRSSSKKPL
jgi:hypothetical protein